MTPVSSPVVGDLHAEHMASPAGVRRCLPQRHNQHHGRTGESGTEEVAHRRLPGHVVITPTPAEYEVTGARECVGKHGEPVPQRRHRQGEFRVPSADYHEDRHVPIDTVPGGGHLAPGCCENDAADAERKQNGARSDRDPAAPTACRSER